MTRWLVTGAGGLLGGDLCAVLADEGEPWVTAADRRALDITHRTAVAAAVTGHDVVINAAAWTDVDGAEAHENAAALINGVAVGYLADACAASNARLIHVSTDYVFAGDAARPYREDARPAPLNAYGRGKLFGEREVLARLPERGYVVRSAWMYGSHGRNFVTTMLRLAADRETIDVVADQYGQPTWSWALARQLVALGRAALAGTAPPGVYHGTSEGETTWYGLARAAFADAGLDPRRIRATTSGRFRRPARRPRYCVLGHDRWRATAVPALPHWRGMLSEAMSYPGLDRTHPAGV